MLEKPFSFPLRNVAEWDAVALSSPLNRDLLIYKHISRVNYSRWTSVQMNAERSQYQIFDRVANEVFK